MPALTGIILLAMVINSCVKDEFELNKFSSDVEWDPNMAVPICKGSLTMRDILQDYDGEELVEEDETGFLYLVYNARVLSYRADEMITLPNQSFADVFTAASDLNPLAVPVGTTITESHSTVGNIIVNSDERLDSVRLNGAELTIIINSDFQHASTIDVEFPTLKKGSLVYKKTINVPVTGGTVTNTYNDLEGYTMDLTNGGSEYNKLQANYTVTMTNSGNPVNATDDITFVVNFANPDYSSMFGYLGNYVQTLSMDSIHLDIFNHILDGEAYFDDPRLYIRMNNSYGMPFQFYLTSLGTYSTSGMPSTPLFGSDVPTIANPRIMNYPTLSQIGTFAADLMLLNKTNSNIMDVIETQPKYIFFSVVAESNPTGPTGDYNFITDSSRFDLDLEVELPLYGSAQYWILQDTADFDFTEVYADSDIVEWIKFRIVADNGMPIEADVQVYFADSNYVVVDSLLEDVRIVESGQLDAIGKVVSKTTWTKDIVWQHDRIQNLKDVKYVFYRGTVNTTNSATALVRIYAHYSIDISLGAQVQIYVDDPDDLEFGN